MSSAPAGSSKVDCSRAAQEVWLVKVPKYLAEAWKSSDTPSGIVGTIRIPLASSANQSVRFELSEQLAARGVGSVDIPREHRMVMSDVAARQSMGLFSETYPEDTTTTPDAANEDATAAAVAPPVIERIAFEGRVAKRADCRPIENRNYVQLKKAAFERASVPQRQVKQIKTLITTYKPVSEHAITAEPERKRKEEGKRVRAAKEDVLELLFGAFERHQYYSLKDLVHLTQQPVVHLKAILKDVCEYNVKNPHKNMYELKSEYRHYAEKEEEAMET